MSHPSDKSESERVVAEFAELTSLARPPGRPAAAPRIRSIGIPAGAISLVVVMILTAIVVSRLPASTAQPGSATLLPTSSPPSPGVTATAMASESAGATPTHSPSVEPSASSQEDLAMARALAAEYETARAGGDWGAAWLLLSPFSQGMIGSISEFEAMQNAYNRSGGSIFELADPSQDPDLLSEAFLGEPYRDVAATADPSRAYLVFINHPDVDGASAASTAVIVAPVAGQDWMVWIAR
jgi:hypothetical protein